MLLTSLPYALGYATQREDMRFTGFVFGVEDGNSYIAKMLSGTAGAWLFRTPYSAVPQRGAPVFLPYLLLGKLAAPPGLHEQLVALFHLFRIGAGFLVILASYDFLSLFLADVRLRRAGTALIVLGGGLGWLPALFGRPEFLGSLPLEFYSPESFGFLALYGLPHLALARALLLWGFAAYLKTVADPHPGGELRNGARAGIFWLLASLAQPLAGLVAGAVCGAYLLAGAAWLAWRGRRSQSTDWQTWRRMVRLALWAGLFVAPLALANFILSRQDPFLQAWMAQNVILSPHPLHYLVAYGLLLPFAVSGGLRFLRREPWKGWLPAAWLLALPLLAYAPVNLQRRLPEGVWVAIVALSLAGFDRHLPARGDVRERGRREVWKLAAYTLAAVLAFPSTAVLLTGGLLAAGKPFQPVFRPAGELSVFQYLGQQGPPGAVVLAAYETGNALPAWAPARVVVGHGPESAGLAALLPSVQAFFASSTEDTDRLEILRDTGARYVFWGPAERTLGSWDPQGNTFLKEIFRQGEYTIYEVIE